MRDRIEDEQKEAIARNNNDIILLKSKIDEKKANIRDLERMKPVEHDSKVERTTALALKKTELQSLQNDLKNAQNRLSNLGKTSSVLQATKDFDLQTRLDQKTARRVDPMKISAMREKRTEALAKMRIGSKIVDDAFDEGNEEALDALDKEILEAELDERDAEECLNDLPSALPAVDHRLTVRAPQQPVAVSSDSSSPLPSYMESSSSSIYSPLPPLLASSSSSPSPNFSLENLIERAKSLGIPVD